MVAFLVGSLLVFLALASFAPPDADYLAGGTDAYLIKNWVGYFGAVVSWALLLLCGFAAYPLVGLSFLSFGRRLFWRRGVRPVRWEYWVAFLLVGLGLAMLFGIWPGLWIESAARLNIRELPGGVIGQLLCSPRNGWMRVFLNPAGSAIVSASLVAAGLVVLWLYDWHALFVAGLAARQARADHEGHPARFERSDDLGPAEGADGADDAEPPAEPAAKRRSPRRHDGEEDAVPSLAERFRRLTRRGRPADGAKAGSDGGAEDEAAVPEHVPPRRPVEPELPMPVAPRPARPAAPSPPAVPAGTGAAKAPEKPAPQKPAVKYKLPALDLLHQAEGIETTVTAEEIETKKEILSRTLDSFGIEAHVGDATPGPRVTLFEVEPAPGVKVERITNISANIAMELRAVAPRILAPIPGRKSVGIEVPNTNPATVALQGLMRTAAWRNNSCAIPLIIGRNISGKPVILDLAKAPHLLIAGATGSGKSVCINAMLMSLLYRFSPAELRLVLVDPKVVEFSCYNSLPHLVVPVITESKKVPLALRWLINEMAHRYQVFSRVGARNIAAFNERPKAASQPLDEKGDPIPERLPYVVLVIDELADIMMTAKAEVETSLARIAQLSRAVGIHTIIATQRPSVNVITGIIKANFPCRIAFQVTALVDSRTILDGKGAESLLGRGDMLFKPPGASKLERIQSPLVEDDEIAAVVGACAAQVEQDFDMSVFKPADSGGGAEAGGGGDDGTNEADEELIQRATEVIARDRRATTSYIQRSLRIGYNRAALVMEILEQRGVIGPQVGTAPREILIAAPQEGQADGETGADGEPAQGENADEGDE